MVKKITRAVILVLITLFLLSTDNIRAEKQYKASIYQYELSDGRLQVGKEEKYVVIKEGMTLGDVWKALNLQAPSYVPNGVKFTGWDIDNENFNSWDAIDWVTNMGLELYATYDKYPIIFNKQYIDKDGNVRYNKNTQYIEHNGSLYDVINFDVPDSDYTFVRWKWMRDQTSSPEPYINNLIVKGENDIVNSCQRIRGWEEITISAKYEEVAIVECAIKDYTGNDIYTLDYLFNNDGWYSRYMIVPSEKVHPLEDQWLRDNFLAVYSEEINNIFDGKPEITFWGASSYDVVYIDDNSSLNYCDVIEIAAIKSNDNNKEESTGDDSQSGGTGVDDATKGTTADNGSDKDSGSSSNDVDEDSKMDASKIEKVKDEIKVAVNQINTNSGATTSEPITIHIDMKKEDGTYATAISKDIIEQAKGTNIVLSFDMGDYSWEIDANDISDAELTDIDMKVTLDSSNISEEDVDRLGHKEQGRYQISLKHHGGFGFKAKLQINLDKKNSGKYGNLYYYNDNGQWEYMNSGYIDESGNVELEFVHASEYVVLIGDKLSGVSSGNEWIMWVIVGGVIIAGIGMAVYMNIAKEKNK